METVQLRGFSDLATHLALGLYDPANRLTSDPELATHHEPFAAFIFQLYGIDPETPDTCETLLPALICDAVESGLDTEEVLLARARREVDVKKLVVPSLQNLVKSTERQARDTLSQMGIRRVPRGKKTLYASAHIAQTAYGNKTRKTGERYYEHPKRAAAMGLYIFNELEAEGYKVDSKFKDAVICAALLHDATEETIRSCKYYSPDRQQSFSPLLVQSVFRRTGNPYGRIVANSLRLMTHYAKQDWAPDYETYVQLGSADFIFSLVKPLDMRDNLLHPKPKPDPMDTAAIEKNRNRRASYRKLIGTMAINAASRSTNTHNRIWTPRYFEILQGITREDIPDMVEDLNRYIYGTPEEPTHISLGGPHNSPVAGRTLVRAA